MGNHEYCEECGASDFHYNRPCDPERKAKHQAEKAAIELRNKQAIAKAKRFISSLKKQGIKAELDSYGNVTISRFDLP